MKTRSFFNILVTVLSILLGFAGLVDESVLGLPSFDYPLYALVCAVIVFYAVYNRKFFIPRKYAIVALIIMGMMIVNAIISKYSPPFIYCVIGGVITFMPFLMFVMYYNLRMEDDEIYMYIRLVIALVLFVSLIVIADSFVFHTANNLFQDGILSSGIIVLGSFSSMCNQAIVLSLAEYFRTSKSLFLIVAGYLAVVVILTNQMKAIVGMMLVVTIFIFYLTRIRRPVKIFIITAGLAGIVAVLSVSAMFMLKFENYFNSAQMEDSYAKIARPALYYRGFEIANDFFPFGSGQGTYGSVPVNLVGSRIYSDYELDKIWGLGDDTDFSFKMDAHWASIIGEMGYIGTVLYLMLFFFPAKNVGKRLNGEDDKIRKYYTYIIRAGILTLFFESIVLALPKSFNFMIVYTGLAALILNRKKRNGRINNSYLQVSDALQDVQHLGQPDKTI